MTRAVRSLFIWGAALGECALVLVLVFLTGGQAHATPPANITNTVGVCDPNYPQRCLAPGTDGSIVVSGPTLTGLAVTGVGPTLTTNSTTANLAGAGVFTGTAVDVTPYSSVTVSVFASHASATNGLSVQQSSDGTNWDGADTYSVAASTNKTVSVQIYYPFLRVVYTNGATPTTTLRITTMGHSIQGIGSSVKPTDGLSLENDAAEVIGFNFLSNGTSADLQRSVQGATGGLGLGVAGVSAIPTSSANVGVVPVTNVGGNAVVGKAGAGNLYSLNAVAPVTAGFVQVLNVTAAPADATTNTPLWCMPLALSTGLDKVFNPPLVATTGITIVFSSSTCAAALVKVNAVYLQSMAK